MNFFSRLLLALAYTTTPINVHRWTCTYICNHKQFNQMRDTKQDIPTKEKVKKLRKPWNLDPSPVSDQIQNRSFESFLLGTSKTAQTQKIHLIRPQARPPRQVDGNRATQVNNRSLKVKLHDKDEDKEMVCICLRDLPLEITEKQMHVGP